VAAQPEPRCELDHRNAFELLVATILSAQSTDARVNQVTPALFRRYPTPAALAKADPAELENLIRSTGFFRNKGKALLGASLRLVEEHGGEVPRSLDAMVELPGVARKTANVVLGTAYGLATGFIVDTHVARVAERLELTRHAEPAKIEADLCKTFPEAEWVDMGHRLVLHGRYICKAKQPDCVHCPLNELCPGSQAAPEGTVAERSAHERAAIPDRSAASV
jgi:endonuclease III